MGTRSEIELSNKLSSGFKNLFTKRKEIDPEAEAEKNFQMNKEKYIKEIKAKGDTFMIKGKGKYESVKKRSNSKKLSK